MSKVIDEIRELTATEVAKKQDAAKNNYPTIIEKIKLAASCGVSHCVLRETEMNEYDKRLLEADGFKVYLEDKPRDWKNKMDNIGDYIGQQYKDKKEWRITW